MKNICKFFCLLTAVCILFSSCDISSLKDFNKDDGIGKTFNYDLSVNPRTLDPQTATQKESHAVIENIFIGLLKINDEGKIVSGAAIEYDISADKRSYTFYLRTDLKWRYPVDENDDVKTTSLTAGDFVFAFKRLFDPKTKSELSERFYMLKNGKKVKEGSLKTGLGVYALSDYVLKFELEEADDDFLYLLTTPPAYPCNEDFFKSTNGRYGLGKKYIASCGSFYITNWQYDYYSADGNMIRLYRNTLSPLPAKPIAVNLFITDGIKPENPFDNFKNGDSDCYAANNSEFSSLSGYNFSEFETSTLGFIFNENIFNNVSTRRNLAYILNFEINSELFRDYDGYEPADSLVPPSVRYSLKDGDKFEPDNLWQTDWTSNGESLPNSVSEVIMLDNPEMLQTVFGYINQKWQSAYGFFANVNVLSKKEYDYSIKNEDYEIALICLKGDYKGVSAYSSKLLEYYSDNNSMSSIDEKQLLTRGYFIPLAYETEYFVSNKKTKDIIYNPFSGAVDFSRALKF